MIAAGTGFANIQHLTSNIYFRVTLSILASAVIAAGSDAGYMEAGLCAACHREIARSYARTGMGRSFRSVQPDSNLPEFDGNTFAHEPSSQFFKPYARDGRYAVRRHQTGPGGAAGRDERRGPVARARAGGRCPRWRGG